ncbi:hypothetical protein RBH29_04335 [Herbivorax sp. ANBcel31]|uniref:hypothetical protein n=1 Tax=Herbivorax sp. ANBcel31 TaxID=3069754 RepID=UPI0027AF8AD5|nr:hypothetical protein [Herbivorax sp. ANBcel31]MDQ2085661.1 hypothetical protein [Herbivorax sp. ANBcel31]
MIVIISCLSGISFLVGKDTNFVYYGWFLISIALFFVAKTYFKYDGSKLAIFSFYMCAFLLIGIVFTSISFEQALAQGRLSVFGNIRVLANALVIPLLFETHDLITNKNKSKSLLYKRSKSLVFLVLLIVLLMTVSRGAIFAYLFGSLIIVLKSKQKRILKIYLILAALYVSIFILEEQGVINILRLFNLSRLQTLGNRDHIWGYYLSELFSQDLLGILFGFGPGELYRVSGGVMSRGAYAHSVPLDFLFTYGIIGATIFSIIMCKLMKRIIKSKNTLAISVFLTTIVLYFTHGTVISREFYILTALVICLTHNEINSQCFINSQNDKQNGNIIRKGVD